MQTTKAFGACCLDGGADLLHDFQIDAEKIVAAHAGLARNAGGDDADVGPCDCLIAVGARARELGIVAFDRCGLSQIERFALSDALDACRSERCRRVP